eukprot:355086-Chlamydomonas_euryale.AAC.6
MLISPGARQAELAVRGNDDVLHEVRVAGQAALRRAVVALRALQLPHQDALVTARSGFEGLSGSLADQRGDAVTPSLVAARPRGARALVDARKVQYK